MNRVCGKDHERPEVSIKSDTVMLQVVTKSLEAPKKGIDLIRKLGRLCHPPHAGKAHKIRDTIIEYVTTYYCSPDIP